MRCGPTRVNVLGHPACQADAGYVRLELPGDGVVLGGALRQPIGLRWSGRLRFSSRCELSTACI